MSIFTRHMMVRFLMPFAFGLGLFAVLIFLGDTFDKMNFIIKSPAPFGIILECLWLGVPYWAVRVVPMATLLATLVAMSGFVHSGEWLATQSCGISTKHFYLPVLWASVVVTVLAFAAQETVMPAAWARSRQLWRDRVHPEWEWTRYENVALADGDGRFLQAWLFLPKDGKMERPIIETFGAGRVVSQLDAKYALWNSNLRHWVFYDGVSREFGEAGVVETPFKSRVSDIVEAPLELIPRPLNPDEMTLRQVRDYARRVGRYGGSPREYEVAAQAKIAYPFANIIVCALGIPLALRLRRSSRVVSFCTALGISFAYLWLMEIGRAFGVGGTLSPVAAAWAANAAFGAVALGLFWRFQL